MKINPIYFLVDSSLSVTEKLRTKRNNALNLLLERITYFQSKMDPVEIAVVRMASSSRKVLSLKKPADVSIPNFKSDKTRGMDLNGALSVLENDSSKIVQPTSRHNKPKVVMFLCSKPAIPFSYIQKLSKSIDSILVVNCNPNIDNESLNRISKSVMDVEDFTNNVDHVLTNWFQINQSVVLTDPIIQTYSDYLDEEKTLTNLIEETKDGGTLTLMPREYRGPIDLNKSIKIMGQGATIWGLSGPVITISSEDVILENLKIEVTGEFESLEDSDRTAIIVKKSDGLVLKEITVKGKVEGIPEEEGIWEYPSSINLGVITYRCTHEFKIKVSVPVNCTVISNISALAVDKTKLSDGFQELTFKLEPLSADMLLDGNIYIKSKNVKRIISINGFISDQAEAKALQGELIWEPMVVVVQVEEELVLSTEDENLLKDKSVLVEQKTADSSEVMQTTDIKDEQEAKDIEEEQQTTDIKEVVENTIEVKEELNQSSMAIMVETPSKENESVNKDLNNIITDPIIPKDVSVIQDDSHSLPNEESKSLTRKPFERFVQPDFGLFSVPIKDISRPLREENSNSTKPTEMLDSGLFDGSNSQNLIEDSKRNEMYKSTPISNLFFDSEKKEKVKDPSDSNLSVELKQSKIVEQNKKRKIVQSQIPSFFQK